MERQKEGSRQGLASAAVGALKGPTAVLGKRTSTSWLIGGNVRIHPQRRRVQVAIGRGRSPSGLTSGSAAASAHCLLPLPDSSPTQTGSPHTPVSTCCAWLWLGSVSPLMRAAWSWSQNEKTKTKLQPGAFLQFPHCLTMKKSWDWEILQRGKPAFRHSACAVAAALPGALNNQDRVAGASLRAGTGPQGPRQAKGQVPACFHFMWIQLPKMLAHHRVHSL